MIIIEDRYMGAYNGGHKWFAVYSYEAFSPSQKDDVTAMNFWYNVKIDDVGFGASPNEARDNLRGIK